MLQDKYKVYDTSRARESNINHIKFIYDELIKLLTRSLSDSGPNRQVILERVLFILQGLLSSVVSPVMSDVAKHTQKFYLSLLKKTGCIVYNKDEKLCLELIEEIKSIREIT